jgi:hypothetical protein
MYWPRANAIGTLLNLARWDLIIVLQQVSYVSCRHTSDVIGQGVKTLLPPAKVMPDQAPLPDYLHVHEILGGNILE